MVEAASQPAKKKKKTKGEKKILWSVSILYAQVNLCVQFFIFFFSIAYHTPSDALRTYLCVDLFGDLL